MMEKPNGQKLKAPPPTHLQENKLEKAEALTETIAAIREGMESAERGVMKPTTQVFAEISGILIVVIQAMAYTVREKGAET